MRRGEIWWAALGAPFGSEPGYRRPVLIVQSNEFNESPIRTVVAVAISSNLRLAGAPGNVLCRKRETGLSKDAVANVSQVATLDRRRLTQRVQAVPERVLQRVEEGLRLVLAL